jgi:hypothetical protein
VDLKSIEHEWTEIEKTPFPSGHRGKSVHGLDLTSLESEAGGLVLTYVQSEGKLGARQLYYIRDIEANLAKIVPELNDSGRTYFERLRKLLAQIIQNIPESDERRLEKE